MIGKLIGVLVVLAMLAFSIGLFYQNLPGEPVELSSVKSKPEPVRVIEYGAVPVFAENLRFNHNNISYKIDTSCSKIRRDAMLDAFSLFANDMQIISFYQTEQEADIDVRCSDDYIPINDQLFAAGEGGPSRIVNASVFKTIEKGEVFLYKDPRCDYPVVEIHELSHVFGFDHSDNPENIMYNTSNCAQRISGDMIQLIKDLYSIKPLPDASLKDVSAIIRGQYLDFNVTILNEGMLSIENISLSLFADGEFIQDVVFGEIEIGYGKTYRYENVRLKSRNVNKIDFIADYNNIVPELNEDNNKVEMVLVSQ